MKVMMFGVETGGTGQTHVHCMRYLNLLKLAGCDVTFVEYRGTNPPNFPNVTYRRYPRRYRRLEKALGTRTAYYLRKQSMRLLWRFVRPDICHVQWVDENLWHTARAGLRPLVVTAWGSDLNYIAELPANNPLRQTVAATLRLIDHLIIDSDDMVATAEELAGKNLSTTLLPIGIDTEQFRSGLHQQRKEWRERLRIDPYATVLISPRQLGANYRQSEVIRAFAALERSYRKQAYLIVRTFGHRFGVSITELHRLAERLNISDRVKWIADLEYSELPGLYAASDLAINFPIIDAFPVTFLECFACGLPVVSNRLVSYASHGASSYLFFAEDDSVGGLKTAIEAAIDRRDQLQTLIAEAREHVVRNYDERVIARILRQTYETVLSRGYRSIFARC
jgi:glycosyltransferase involved in cell wall biosynthesis